MTILMKRYAWILLLSILPQMLKSAVVREKIDGIWYEINTETPFAEVIAPQVNGEMYSGEIKIPIHCTYNETIYEVNSIGNYAFSNCYALRTISLPHSLKTIGNSAFSGCCSIYSIDLPELLTTIGDEAFMGCSMLKYVAIPGSVTSIGGSAFENCTRLETVALPDKLTSINNRMFCFCRSLYTIMMPTAVESIGEFAFAHCTSLLSITIPDNVKEIGMGTFYGCSGLTTIVLPEQVSTIGNSAFLGCSSLFSFTTPSSLTSISQSMFARCSSLRTIVISQNIKEIGAGAFNYCNNLTEVICYADKVPSAKSDDFYEVDLNNAQLCVPYTSIEDYKKTSPWSLFANIKAIYIESDDPGAPKCAEPIITILNGKVSFECETEGATLISKVVAADANNYLDDNIDLKGKYYIEVYAAKAGYRHSDIVTKEFYVNFDVKGDTNGDGVIDAADVVKLTNIIMNQ